MKNCEMLKQRWWSSIDILGQQKSLKMKEQSFMSHEDLQQQLEELGNRPREHGRKDPILRREFLALVFSDPHLNWNQATPMLP